MKIGEYETDTISDREKLAEVERELEQRWRVYPRLVRAGKMTPKAKDKQIATMIAIRDDLRARLALEKPEGRLL